jgi:uncharacterized protein (TIGR03435 family)
LKLPVVWFVLAWVAPLTHGQPAFEAASIKPSPADHVGAQMYSPGPGRFTALTATLKDLIPFAYQVLPSQLEGGPGWAGSTAYDITAKMAGSTSNGDLRLMLQALLADRFQLKVRRETKEVGVYNLVVDKNGPRMESVAAAGRGVGLQNGTMRAFGADMATLASVLSRHVGRVVIDRTGLKGYYNFTLQWTADDLDASGTALFQAIEEQLGLKLEAAKAPVEILVIERAERASEN